ncbi:restriction endonuclease subunit S [Alcaligenaceae bacterium]|nr:restriction endonuclease subunit S [Alcaligenaceae bacterium]
MSFPKYPAYKDSGVEWLGEVPDHWMIGRLKNVAKIRSGQDYKDVETEDKEAIPVIGSGGPFAFATDYLFDGESVLLGRKGTIDKPLYINGKFWTVDTMFYTEISSQSIPRFVYYLASVIPFSYYSTSTALPSMSQFDLSNHCVVIPRRLEQSKIANFLDHETAKIDVLIEEQQRLIELLKEKRQAVISLAVTKGLDPSVPMKNSGVEWLGEVPAHWDVKKVKYGVGITGGFAFQSSDFIDEGILLIKIGNLYENKFQPDRQPTYLHSSFLASHSDWVVSGGDLLISLTGTLGKQDYGFAILMEGGERYLLNQRVAKVVAHSLFNNLFLKFVLQGESYLNRLYSLPEGTKQANLSNDDVVGIEVGVPPLKEQKDIADFLHVESSKIATMIVTAEFGVALLNERRSALISAAVTGKIDVRGWQPANPPSQELNQENKPCLEGL